MASARRQQRSKRAVLMVLYDKNYRVVEVKRVGKKTGPITRYPLKDVSVTDIAVLEPVAIVTTVSAAAGHHCWITRPVLRCVSC